MKEFDLEVYYFGSMVLSNIHPEAHTCVCPGGGGHCGGLKTEPPQKLCTSYSLVPVNITYMTKKDFADVHD